MALHSVKVNGTAGCDGISLNSIGPTPSYRTLSLEMCRVTIRSGGCEHFGAGHEGGNVKKGKSNAIDLAVGARIKNLRLRNKLSQTQLGKQVNVTFQQIQKYESGANRVSAGRLAQLANFFGVAVAAFYSEVPDDSGRQVNKTKRPVDRVSDANTVRTRKCVSSSKGPGTKNRDRSAGRRDGASSRLQIGQSVTVVGRHPDTVPRRGPAPFINHPRLSFGCRGSGFAYRDHSHFTGRHVLLSDHYAHWKSEVVQPCNGVWPDPAG